MVNDKKIEIPFQVLPEEVEFLRGKLLELYPDGLDENSLAQKTGEAIRWLNMMRADLLLFELLKDGRVHVGVDENGIYFESTDKA